MAEPVQALASLAAVRQAKGVRGEHVLVPLHFPRKLLLFRAARPSLQQSQAGLRHLHTSLQSGLRGRGHEIYVNILPLMFSNEIYNREGFSSIAAALVTRSCIMWM